MKRFRKQLFAILFLICSASVSNAATHYVCAATGAPCNAADSNAGTSKTATWLHAPGMANCSGNCASYTPAAGDLIIFRGGDSWHTSNSGSGDGTSNVYMGTSASCGGGDAGTCGWYWHWSGSSGNDIYLGVDLTWYSGGSFARPIINLDNPTWANSTNQDGSHIGWVTSCTHDDAAFTGLDVHATFVQVDNFEFTGKCWASIKTYGACSEMQFNGANGGAPGNGTIFSDSYVHGWTMTFSGGQASVFDKCPVFGGTGSLWQVTYSVFDGTDAGPPCNASGNCSGDLVDPSGTMGVQNWDHNVFRRLANTTNGPSDTRTVHDNLFEYMYDSFDTTTHSDVFFTFGNNAPSGTNFAFYNNMLRNVSAGQTFAIDSPSAGSLHFFNNILFNVGNSTNCLQVQNTDTNNASVFFANNTIDSPCTLAMNFNNNLVYVRNQFQIQNMHIVGFGAISSPICGVNTSTNSFCTTSGNAVLTSVTDNGNELFQTEATANGQGYTTSNNYQPTSTGGASYHAGANLSSSCSSYSSDSALCSGSTGGVTNTAGTGNVPTLYILSPPARGATWDAGAYQFVPGSTGMNVTGLTLFGLTIN